MQAATSSIILGIAMLAVFALVAGGAWLIRKRRVDRTRGVLMVVAAVVLLGNVLIATWPA